MKKLSFLFMSLLAVTLLTACGSDDEPVNKQVVSATMNTRAIDGDDVVFSQGSAKVELNYTDMTIQFTSEYKDADGQTRSFITPEMPMKSTSNTVYSFNSTSSASTGIDNFQGKIDLYSGMMWLSFMDGGTRVVSTTHLYYAYTTTNMTNLENGNHGSHQQAAYLFALDARGETCIMQITNLISNLNGSVDAAEVRYDGLMVTPTPTGYTITADEVESNYKGFYTITDVNITLNDQCNILSGSFMCNGLKHEISGGLFSYSL